MPDDCVGDAREEGRLRSARRAGLPAREPPLPRGKEKDDEAFARELAELCDVYVDDAFGAVHRAHASVHALPQLMRERGAGFLLEKELDALGKLVDRPEKPYVAVLGGAKVSRQDRGASRRSSSRSTRSSSAARWPTRSSPRRA